MAVALVVSVPILIAGALGGPAETECLPGFTPSGQSAVLTASAPLAGLDEAQLRHAATIIEVGRARQIPDQGIVIALAAALQESRLRVYANDGTGDLAPDQLGIEASLEFPHDAVGRDHGSLGILQQQWPWWGSMAALMNPATSAGLFYDALGRVSGWEDLPLTVAAQTVQSSAHPAAYADDEPLARRLLAELGSGGVVGVAGDCRRLGGGGVVQHPLRTESGYVDQRNFGATGAAWASRHTGTDFSVSCGTPVHAAHAGTIRILDDQPWAGPWLVQVEVGPGRLTTWYAHMQSVGVDDGDWVMAGQLIGTVGQEGNATGCHLHFEVHPRGGGIYEDPVDPSAWLADNIGRGLDMGTAEATLVTANIPFTISRTAARRHLATVMGSGADVVVLQEVRNLGVRRVAERRAPGVWAIHHPKGGSAVIWRTARFQAEKRGTAVGFHGAAYDRWMPWVSLRTGSGERLTVIGVHMPPQPRTSARQRRYYWTMLANYQRLVRDLREQGIHPVAAGDWNAPLDSARVDYSPVRANRELGMTTNWMLGEACGGGTIGRSRFDGFALDDRQVTMIGHGCLARGPSDHRPVWIRLG